MTPSRWKTKPAGSRNDPASVSSSARRSATDPDRLDVDELADAERPELPPIARLLDAAERHLRIRRHHRVDEDHPRLELGDEPGALPVVAGPDAGPEPEGRVVGEPDRLVGGGHSEEERHRAEELLPPGRRLAADIREHGGLVVPPLPLHPMAPGENARARGHGALDL